MGNNLTQDEKRQAANILGYMLAEVHMTEPVRLGDWLAGGDWQEPRDANHGPDICPTDNLPIDAVCEFHPEGVAIDMPYIRNGMIVR